MDQFADLVDGGRVNRRIYTDPAVFEEEMERIFSRTWTFIGHEDEVPSPGDFKMVEVAGQPMVLVRDEQQIRLFANTCRHRGALVCREPEGNVRFFKCLYHGWSYDRSGHLVGVPHPQAYGPDFRKEDFGLVEAPCVQAYNQLIFASLSTDVADLEDHLGPARQWLDLGFRPEGGMKVYGYHRYRFRANWKLIAENTIDGYHAGYLHKMVARAPGQYLQGRSVRLPNGHGVLAWDGQMKFDENGGHGRDSARGPEDPFDNRITALFPNLLALDVNETYNLRRVIPKSVDETEVIAYALAPARDSQEQRRARLQRYPMVWGPAGVNGADDVETFELCQAGFKARLVEWSDMSRGSDEVDEGDIGDETGVRGVYQQWARLMSSGAPAYHRNGAQ